VIRAVLDTNILASGAIARRGTIAAILDAWRGQAFTLIVSQVILAELGRTLQNPYFATRLSPALCEGFLDLVYSEAVVVLLRVTVAGVATHPEDDLILATAVSGHADYLVTGDQPFQDLGLYRDVQIISPGEFLALLEERAEAS
jgi:putative PIN family toxin of toxin-antitoxin system